MIFSINVPVSSYIPYTAPFNVASPCGSVVSLSSGTLQITAIPSTLLYLKYCKNESIFNLSFFEPSNKE